MSIFSFFSSFYLSLYVMWYYYFVGKTYSISVFFLWLFPIFWREKLICGLFSWVKNIQKWKFIVDKIFVSKFSTLCWEKTNFSAYFNENIPRITKLPRFNLRHHSCKQFELKNIFQFGVLDVDGWADSESIFFLKTWNLHIFF